MNAEVMFSRVQPHSTTTRRLVYQPADTWPQVRRIESEEEFLSDPIVFFERAGLLVAALIDYNTVRCYRGQWYMTLIPLSADMVSKDVHADDVKVLA